MIKTCKIHGDVKFFARKDANAWRCTKCASDAVTRRRQKLKRLAVEDKGGSCQRCGYKKSIRSLDFHHLDPTQKDFGISVTGHTLSWKRIKEEIDKCILVCKNCHGEIHEELQIEEIG